MLLPLVQERHLGEKSTAGPGKEWGQACTRTIQSFPFKNESFWKKNNKLKKQKNLSGLADRLIARSLWLFYRALTKLVQFLLSFLFACLFASYLIYYLGKGEAKS